MMDNSRIKPNDRINITNNNDDTDNNRCCVCVHEGNNFSISPRDNLYTGIGDPRINAVNTLDLVDGKYLSNPFTCALRASMIDNTSNKLIVNPYKVHIVYRKTRKQKEMYSRMGKASVKARSELSGNDRVPLLPDLRIRITVERFDCGDPEKHVFELKEGKRIDMYRTYVDGEKWKHCGLSAVLAGIRKSLPRIISEYQ